MAHLMIMIAVYTVHFSDGSGDTGSLAWAVVD
jgi:hypothetical protein